MKHAFTALIFLLLFLPATGQTFSHIWAEQGVQNGDFCTVTCMYTDNQANTFIGFEFSETVQWGELSLTPTAGTDMGIAKFDSSGNVLWLRSAGSQFNDRITAIAVNAGGQVFFTGSLRGDAQFGNISIETAVGGGVQETFFLAALSSSGDWLWVEIQQGTAIAYGSALATNAEGTAIVCGVYSGGELTCGNQNFPEGFDRQIFVVAYSVGGNSLWSTLGSTEFGAEVFDIVTTPNGFAICGTFGNAEAVETTLSFDAVQMVNVGDQEGITASDMFVAGFDDIGNCLWGRNAGAVFYDAQANHLATDALGNLVVSGLFFDELITDNNALSVSALGEEGNIDFFLAGLAPNGDWLWLNALNNADGGFEFTQVQSAPDGQVLFGGRLPAGGHAFGNVTLQNNPGQEGFLVALSPTSGNYLWARNHPGFELLSAASGSTPKLNLSIAGKYTSELQLGNITLPLTGGASADAYVCRFDYIPQGNALVEAPANRGFELYPNPSDELLNIAITNQFSGQASLLVFNSVGQILYSDMIRQPQFTLNAKALNLSSGVYFVTIVCDNEISTQRWVLK